MGLRPLDGGAWVEPGPELPEQLLLKRRLVAERPDEVTATVEDPEGSVLAAATELRDELARHLLLTQPGRYRRPGDPRRVPVGGLEVAEGPTVDFGDGLHPVTQAGLLTQEDWCVHLAGADGRLRLVAASVCFPTRWVLADKVGRTVEEIHAPVTAYRDQLAGPVERFLARLVPESPMWRLNWNLVDRPELFQPTAGAPPQPPLTESDAGARTWLRVERQTFVRLPVSAAVVFGIRVHQARLDEAVTDAVVAQRLLGAIEALPPATRREKGLDRFAVAVTGWLRRFPP
jgi:hypothetical protein